MNTEAIQLDREDIILLMLEANERVLGKDVLSGITRLEKLLFLLDRETDFEGIGDFYRFEAHNFGPFSKEVYEAIEFLSACELIDVREKTYPSLYASRDEAKLLSEISDEDFSYFEHSAEPADEAKWQSGSPDDHQSADSESWRQSSVQATEKQFALTENGRKVASIMRDAVARRRKSDVEELDGIVRRFGNRPLNHLIRYVYRQYPDMTVKSIHPEAQKLSHVRY